MSYNPIALLREYYQRATAALGSLIHPSQLEEITELQSDIREQRRQRVGELLEPVTRRLAHDATDRMAQGDRALRPWKYMP